VPIKRRLSKQIDGRITPSAVAAYQRALALREQAWRGEGDLEEVAEAESAVERALGIRMWEPSVFGLDTFWEPSDDPDYLRAADLRDRLNTALADARRPRATVSEPEPTAA
jgi:hypothetical protein